MSTTRRQFLAHLAGAAAPILGLGLPTAGRWVQSALAGGGTTEPDHPVEALDGARSRLLAVVNTIVVKKNQVSDKFLGQMLRVGLTRFLGESSERDAWRRIIGGGRNVLIKFNRSGADELATTGPLIAVLLESLERADVERGRVMLLDVAADQHRKSGTAEPISGYQARAVRVLDKEEQFSAALDWADCLINVPFIKDHHLAGVTCGMKNLSHGLIRGPARWHGDRCRLSVPHLFAAPPIRDKLILTICNALRIVIDKGPAVAQEHIVEHSRLIFATDVPALDAHAARIIDQERGAHGLRDLAEAGRPPKFLNVARELGLGQTDLDRVDLAEFEG